MTIDPNDPKYDLVLEIASLLDLGYSNVKIGKCIGFSDVTVSNYIKKYELRPSEFCNNNEKYDVERHLFYVDGHQIRYREDVAHALGIKNPLTARCTKNTLKHYELELLEDLANEYDLEDINIHLLYKNGRYLEGIIRKHFGSIRGYIDVYWNDSREYIGFEKNRSIAESKIYNLLREFRVPFEDEYRFEGCRSKYPLPFDFVIFKNGHGVVGAIEYDGEQHYSSVGFWGGSTELHKRQRRDAIKTKYCADNGIPLLRIPYTEFDNIEAIVAEWLSKIKDRAMAA